MQLHLTVEDNIHADTKVSSTIFCLVTKTTNYHNNCSKYNQYCNKIFKTRIFRSITSKNMLTFMDLFEIGCLSTRNFCA